MMSRFIMAGLGWNNKDNENQGKLIPNSRFQIPDKFKSSKFKSKAVLNLCGGLRICLGFGIWCLGFT
jgi:hypothetical protein